MKLLFSVIWDKAGSQLFPLSRPSVVVHRRADVTMLGGHFVVG